MESIASANCTIPNALIEKKHIDKSRACPPKRKRMYLPTNHADKTFAFADSFTERNLSADFLQFLANHVSPFFYIVIFPISFRRCFRIKHGTRFIFVRYRPSYPTDGMTAHPVYPQAPFFGIERPVARGFHACTLGDEDGQAFAQGIISTLAQPLPVG